MKERKLFQEVPGRRSDFHSALLTSYSFNFHHFEYQVLRTLRRKWITNVSVLVDQHMLDGSIGLASGSLQHLSQTYSVNGVRSMGAFHPKMNFLVGDNKLLLFFGSGNITPGGHGKNHELFTSFYADALDSAQLPILQEAWDFLQGLTSDVAGYNKERMTRQITANNSLLGTASVQKHAFHTLDDGMEVALLYNESTSIFSQLVDLVPSETVNRISIICPYYDQDGATVLALKQHFYKAPLDLYLPSDFGLDPVNMEDLERINFYIWEKTSRGKTGIGGDSTYARKLHSKIFHFEAGEYEYLLLGSANATRAGFGTREHRGANDEFCALYKSPTSNLLSRLGIKGKKLVTSELKRSSSVSGDEGRKAGAGPRMFIKAVDLQGETLTVYLNSKRLEPEVVLVIYNSLGEEVHRLSMRNSTEEFQTSLPKAVMGKDLSYAQMLDAEGNHVSNKQLINQLDKLFQTDPSKANRTINQVISGLETGSINEFEVLAYLNDANQVHEVQHSHRLRVGAREEKDGDVGTIEMTYDQAVQASKDPEQRQKIIRTHNSFRLWESITRLLLVEIQRRSDDLEDEEEDGSTGQSNVRKNDPPPPPPARDLTVEQLVGQVQRLVKKYKASLTRVTNMDGHRIDVIDFVQFLLVSHIVTALTYFNDGEAFRKKGKEEYTDSDWRPKLQETFKHEMKDIVTHFNKLLVRQHLVEAGDDTDQYARTKLADYKSKTIYYSLLYSYLLDSLSMESFMKVDLELLAFNLFERFGLTDVHFEQYMDDISKKDDEVLFNAFAAIKWKDELEGKYVDLDKHQDYFRVDHSGWCLVKERDNHEAKYGSIYGTRRIPLSQLKKYQKGKN